MGGVNVLIGILGIDDKDQEKYGDKKRGLQVVPWEISGFKRHRIERTSKGWD